MIADASGWQSGYLMTGDAGASGLWLLVLPMGYAFGSNACNACALVAELSE